MKSSYARAADRLDRALRRRGALLRLQRVSAGTYDPNTSSVISGVPVFFECYAFREALDLESLKNERIPLFEIGDYKFLVSGKQKTGILMPAPDRDDTLLFAGGSSVVLHTIPMNFTGELVGYEVYARG